MHQTISVGVILVLTLLFNAPVAAVMASNGNWGEAFGRLIFAPFVVFFVFHTVIYFLYRALFRKGRVASYSGSKLNYIAMTIVILSLLGSVASHAPQT